MAVTYGDTASLYSILTDLSHGDTRGTATSQQMIQTECFETEYQFRYDVLQPSYRYNYCVSYSGEQLQI